MKTNIVILISVLALGGGFGGGYSFRNYQLTKLRGNFRGQVQGIGTRNGQGFRPVNGEILSMDDKSITVKLADGSSKIVLLTDTTTISKSDTATKSDLKVGDKVAAFGTANSDGSVTATNVQLNPVERFASPQPQSK